MKEQSFVKERPLITETTRVLSAELKVICGYLRTVNGVETKKIIPTDEDNTRWILIFKETVPGAINFEFFEGLTNALIKEAEQGRLQ